MTDALKKRDSSLDLIRTAAVTLVVSVHFFLNNGYYSQPLVGERMLVMTVLRMAFMTCVPLFLLLTGALCRDKTLSPRYYLGLTRVLLTYVLCGGVCFALKLWRGEALGWRDLLRSLLNFSAAPYGWYIEMYIGLFLLIPFLNALWRGLAGREQRRALVVTLLALTALPALAVQFLPDWWMRVYPLCYYFLGAWFAEYDPRPDWRWTLCALAATVAAEGAFVFWRGGGEVYTWSAFGDWQGPGVVLSSCLLFLLLRQLPVDRGPMWLRWLLYKGSELSLGAYLLSWCFDTAFYPILDSRVPEMVRRLEWLPVMVPAVLLPSLLAAQGVEWVRKGVTWCINKLAPGARLR